ncbi:MAG: pyrophosphohydrolase [Parcubacteria bacterium C7867-005]|nr:MAG: pyrophosphohydrolase [Parcubacteria bacterium C7867-005]
MKKERHKIISASYLLLFQDEKVLLLRRFNTGYEDGNYSVPAGHVDKGESVLDCLVREAKEEIDVLIDKKDVGLVHVMHRNGTDHNDEHLDFFFTCSKWDGELKNMEPEKCDDLSWFNLQNLPQNTIPYILRALEDVRDKKLYSESDW